MRYKDKERILKNARAAKPDRVRFLADLSKYTLGKRQELVPDMTAARKVEELHILFWINQWLPNSGPRSLGGP